ncbi:MAG: 2-octaprenyl-6-methoxyphenyl hydroxylase [Gammaproteobacteria bacterium]|nr:MAG: 2-octaprenyl-6-methoxyphenyl hydroxylase [Gammaproteobacteria bacterium]
MARADKSNDSCGDFDVLIAGGGLVGGSLAIALAGTSCRVGLVEAIPPDSDVQPSFDDRTIALSRGSYRILNELGIWPLIADSVWPIHKIHVSEQKRFGTALIDADEQGIPELGFVIKSRRLGQALWQKLGELPTVTTFCPARVTATEIEAGLRSVTLAGATVESLSTQLLVVADGARSELRGALGIQSSDRDYGQVAVVANIQVDPQRAGCVAYERFTPEGPVAILPGRDGLYTVVLARTSESAPTVMSMSDDEILDLVQSAFGFRLGRFTRIGQRFAYPLHLVTADSIVAERAVVIGNAANGLHPVAAQGFNLGLRDVASLGEVIADGYGLQAAAFDPGTVDILTSYCDWRCSDQRKVVGFTDSLIRMFGIPGAPASIGRGLALAAFDMVPGAKQELARQTMGLSGRLSRLARGLPL